jgi:hypothetical protein
MNLSYDDQAALAARIKALIETDDEDTQDCTIPALDLLRECYAALAQPERCGVIVTLANRRDKKEPCNNMRPCSLHPELQ